MEKEKVSHYFDGTITPTVCCTMKSQKCKFLLLHILLLCSLALLVLKYVEEIQMFKQTIYDTIHPKSVSETTDDPITLYPVEINGDEWFVEHPLIYHAGGAIEGQQIY